MKGRDALPRPRMPASARAWRFLCIFFITVVSAVDGATFDLSLPGRARPPFRRADRHIDFPQFEGGPCIRGRRRARGCSRRHDALRELGTGRVRRSVVRRAASRASSTTRWSYSRRTRRWRTCCRSSFPTTARNVGIDNSFINARHSTRMEDEVVRVIRAHDGPIYSLADRQPSGVDALLVRGLLKVTETCIPVHTNIVATPLELCRVVRKPVNG